MRKLLNKFWNDLKNNNKNSFLTIQYVIMFFPKLISYNIYIEGNNPFPLSICSNTIIIYHCCYSFTVDFCCKRFYRKCYIIYNNYNYNVDLPVSCICSLLVSSASLSGTCDNVSHDLLTTYINTDIPLTSLHKNAICK